MKFRSEPLLLFLLVLSTILYAIGNVTVEGGDVVKTNVSTDTFTSHWAAVVGWMNTSVTPNVSAPIGFINATNATVYVTYINGSFANQTAILTRLSERPSPSPGKMLQPTRADFDNGGMFSNFTTFNGLNFSLFYDSPLKTFCNPCVYGTCNVGNLSLRCLYIILNPNTTLGVLKYFDGSITEPIFVVKLGPQPGYNGSTFDFQYMVPRNESYYFYTYTECTIDTYIDGVNTTNFSKTGIPYEVRVVVLDPGSNSPIPNAEVRISEDNGRNLLFPVLLSSTYIQRTYAIADASGQAFYAIAPTRYNIPDSYNYDIYVEVTSPVYCIKHLNITNYGSLSPTYRTSLVNNSYASQVKSSVQNMNSIAATATEWITSKKIREYSLNVSENGTTTTIPTLKAGAPNRINITALNDSGDPFIADMTIREDDGFIIVAPHQPDKNFSNAVLLNTSQSLLVIPTRYNNNANLTVRLYKNMDNFANITFQIDSNLEPPQSTEAEMDDSTYSLIASSLQNINMILANMGQSISQI